MDFTHNPGRGTVGRATFARVVLGSCALLAAPSRSRAQSSGSVSLFGKVTHGNASTSAGDRVLAYDLAGSRKWIGPALTDDYGVYSFYDLTPGPYVLRVYVAGQSVWNNQITVRPTKTRCDIELDR